MNLSAESIALHLEKSRRIRADHYTACCPAHDDRTPSLSITQAPDTVLLYCHSGCSQSEVIDALLSLGLWAKKSKGREAVRPFYTKDDLEYYRIYCLIYRDNVRNGHKPSEDEDRQFRSFFKVCDEQGAAHDL